MHPKTPKEEIAKIVEVLNKHQKVDVAAKILKMTSANLYRIIHLYIKIEEPEKKRKYILDYEKYATRK